jgi:hypothetical protein
VLQRVGGADRGLDVPGVRVVASDISELSREMLADAEVSSWDLQYRGEGGVGGMYGALSDFACSRGSDLASCWVCMGSHSCDGPLVVQSVFVSMDMGPALEQGADQVSPRTRIRGEGGGVPRFLRLLPPVLVVGA